MDVKSQFYRAFSTPNYPDHFMYRSKARPARSSASHAQHPHAAARADALRAAGGAAVPAHRGGRRVPVLCVHLARASQELAALR
jgi:hypothetical protein